MKILKQTAASTFCLSLPVFLLLAGCDNSTKTTDSGSASASTATAHVDTKDGVPTSQTTAPDADNSANNARDRSGNTLTPGDQGNSEADRAVTQRIRQSIVGGTNNAAGVTNDFSVTAKNVKIITADGKVTLRGPVNTPEEKTGIESIAKAVAGDGNVDDQLEVKSNQ
jgi:osmotically-inducible protein OsmY